MKYRLVFQRSEWDGYCTAWPDIKTVIVEIPDFDYSKECNTPHYQLVGGELIKEEKNESIY